MKAAVLGRFGDNSEIRIAEVALPLLGDHDVLIRVHAASVNPVDVKTRQGKMQVLLKYQLPLVLGNDVAGTVTEVGARVTRFRKGDAVFARVDADRIGTFAEYVAVSENATARKPRNVTCEEAASLPLVALTAWQTLVDIGRIGPGQRVLVHAGSGGVGSIAIQLARHLGATVYTTVGARNVALVKQLGADVAIDYPQERFEEVASNCDVVLDSAGGDTLVRCFSAVKPSGVVVSINSNTPSPAFARAWSLNPFLVFAIRLLSRKVLAAARSRGARYEYCFVRADGSQLAQIADLVEQGVLRPVIDRIYPLAEVQEALAYSEAGRATGKVVVQVVASP